MTEPKKRHRTKATPSILRAIVKEVSDTLAGYSSIADEMESKGIASIEMTGIDTLERQIIQRLKGNIVAARRALNDSHGGISSIVASMGTDDPKPTKKKKKPS